LRADERRCVTDLAQQHVVQVGTVQRDGGSAELGVEPVHGEHPDRAAVGVAEAEGLYPTAAFEQLLVEPEAEGAQCVDSVGLHGKSEALSPQFGTRFIQFDAETRLPQSSRGGESSDPCPENDNLDRTAHRTCTLIEPLDGTGASYRDAARATLPARNRPTEQH
jgi:hypothetical protein